MNQPEQVERVEPEMTFGERERLEPDPNCGECGGSGRVVCRDLACAGKPEHTLTCPCVYSRERRKARA